MLSSKHAILGIKITAAVLAMFLSIFVLASWVPNSPYIKSSVESIDNSKATVEKFAGVTMGTAVTISLLPGDFGSPLSNTLSDMEKYFMFIVVVLIVYKLILTQGIAIAFHYIIPFACVAYIASLGIKRGPFKGIAVKLLILALSLILVIPLSTHFTEKVGADYMQYVNDTIEETQAGADKIKEVTASGSDDKSILDKVSEVFSSAVNGASELVDYLKDQINRCMNAIAILIVTTCVIPIIVMFVFKWILGQLFNINFGGLYVSRYMHHRRDDRERIEDHREREE